MTGREPADTPQELAGSTETPQDETPDRGIPRVTDWRSQVYSTPEKRKRRSAKPWAVIRRDVIRRDHQACRRCRKNLTYKGCSIHHILPRDEGGGDHLQNLIVLCPPCHNWVEASDPPLRTKTLIEASKEAKVPLYGKGDGPYRPDWHAIVYGGVRP